MCQNNTHSKRNSFLVITHTHNRNYSFTDPSLLLHHLLQRQGPQMQLVFHMESKRLWALLSPPHRTQHLKSIVSHSKWVPFHQNSTSEHTTVLQIVWGLKAEQSRVKHEIHVLRLGQDTQTSPRWAVSRTNERLKWFNTAWQRCKNNAL